MISLSDRSSHYGLLMGNFAVSTLGWLVTAGLMLLDPQLLLQHYYQGRTIAMVHSFTLLTISPAILGLLFCFSLNRLFAILDMSQTRLHGGNKLSDSVRTGV